MLWKRGCHGAIICVVLGTAGLGWQALAQGRGEQELLGLQLDLGEEGAVEVVHRQLLL